MKRPFSRAMMKLACRCLGDGRREWASAMLAEFDAAAEDGRAMSFAFGCLVGAIRQMPWSEEGRFVVTNYALALGIMLPMAAVQVGCAAFGLPYLFPGQDGLRGLLTPGQEVLFGGAYRAAMPSLSALMLLSGIGQLRIAWLMLDRDWGRVGSIGMGLLAALITLVLFMASLFLDARQALTMSGVLLLELAVIAGLARWHADLRPLTEDLAT